jgi:hypothetical protein
MPETTYRDRRAFAVENDRVRVTVLVEGGHVAEIRALENGINPLWAPPWPSIEPSAYTPQQYPEYGGDADATLLAGIMGHNLCMDIFGGPSAEEAAAGMPAHGEASVATYDIAEADSGLVMRACFPHSQLAFERRIRLWPGQPVVVFQETVENLSAADRPIGWTQHVTLGPPFLEKGSTQFRASATRSKVYETDFVGGGKGYMKIGAEFDWPYVPLLRSDFADLRVFTDLPESGGYTAHLMDRARTYAHFVAFSPKVKVAFGYVWRREDFPWLGIWEENYSRSHRPWNARALTRGMEFGASPMPESRRQMIARGSMFGVPGFRWIPARGKVTVEYRAAIAAAESVPDDLVWSEPSGARFV